jgi:hypothetical protein
MFLAFLMLFRAEGGYSTPVSVTMLVLLGYCFPLLAMNDVGSDTRSWLPPSVLMHVMVVRTLDNVTSSVFLPFIHMHSHGFSKKTPIQ